MADEHRISLEEAVQMVARARQNPDLEIKGWQFGASIIREILDHPGVTGLRAYVADDGRAKPTLVLVGTDDLGNDVASGTIAELAKPCPPFCDESSPFHNP